MDGATAMTTIITGGASGLGLELCKAIPDAISWDLKNGVDVSSWADVHEAAKDVGPIDVLINCAGVNYIDWFEDLTPNGFEYVMAVNAMGIFNCTHALLSKLRNGTVCNIISNAAHMPMRASLAYNASKAAAAMMTRQMAHELWPWHYITVFGVSPNRLAGTQMSKDVTKRVAQIRDWTLREAQSKQLVAMPIGEETPPALVAEFIAFLLSSKERHKYLHGCIIPYGSDGP
jgi:NAD(P)-dependent dehydrogenase (short-subunit alcohol dehydrogenase family)